MKKEAWDYITDKDTGVKYLSIILTSGSIGEEAIVRIPHLKLCVKIGSLCRSYYERRKMLEELLTELRYKGYNVTIRRDDFTEYVNIHMKKKFKDQWHGINHLVPFCEADMIYAPQLIVSKMEKEMKGE